MLIRRLPTCWDAQGPLNHVLQAARPILRDSTDSVTEFETLAKGQATFSILQNLHFWKMILTVGYCWDGCININERFR